MSHAPERNEKNCLNCGTTVTGRYCQDCGQENIVPKESFGHLVVHFFYDITHFDGKFFVTLKDLLFKPGFLSSEYTKGKRMSYLNPIRMYVFTSAIFFLFFFMIAGPKAKFKSSDSIPLTYPERLVVVGELEDELRRGDKEDSVILLKMLDAVKDTSKPITRYEIAAINPKKFTVNVVDVKYTSEEEYKEAQDSLPEVDRDGWFKRKLVYRQITLNQRMRANPDGFANEFISAILHKFPYMLFVSLPLFALILKLLYVRRKSFYYADHAIFSIHHYILSFILLLLILFNEALKAATGWDWLTYLTVALVIAWPVYLFLAMHKFYGQNWFKTFLKFLLLNIIGFITLITLLVFFFFFAVFQI